MPYKDPKKRAELERRRRANGLVKTTPADAERKKKWRAEHRAEEARQKREARRLQREQILSDLNKNLP
jgi:hypothetical protein